MQNKGIVIVTAVLLTLASIFYLSFSVATSYYDKQAAKIKDPIAQQDYKDSVKYLEDCEKLFKLDGFSGGVELGVGWRFTRLFGVTGDFLYEYNFSGAHLLTLSPGFAFSLKDVWPWANRTLASLWISVEASFQRYFNRGVPDWASTGFLGLQVGI
jgi:hypothetical protein